MRWLLRTKPLTLGPMADLREQLRDIIAEVAELDDPRVVTDEANLYADLGLDSMQALEIVLEIERRFDITVAESDLREIQSLGDAVLVAQRLGAKKD